MITLLVGCVFSYYVNESFAFLVGWLAVWLVGWFVGWLLVDWLEGSFICFLVSLFLYFFFGYWYHYHTLCFVLHFNPWKYIYNNSSLNAPLVSFLISVDTLLPKQKFIETWTKTYFILAWIWLNIIDQQLKITQQMWTKKWEFVRKTVYHGP